jgi:hypothetical protein
LNGQNIPFVNHVKYLGVIFDKRISGRLHKEMLEAKAFRTFIRIYSLFGSERLSADIKLALLKALILSVMTYACLARELAADTYLLNCKAYETKFSAPWEVFLREHKSAICIRLSNPYV